MILYQHQPDEAGFLKGTPDEHENSWWPSQLSFASIALSAALAITATTSVASTVYTYDVQEPATSLHGQADEDFWQNPVAPVVGTNLAPQPYTWVQDEVGPPAASLGVDEDLWNGPLPANFFDNWKCPAPWIYGYEDNPGGLVGQPDEDFWNSGVTPVPATMLAPLPFSWDQGDFPQPPPPVLPPDEDFWVSGVAPIPASMWISPISLIGQQDETPIPPPPGQPDEDFWINPVAPVVATNLWPQPSIFDVQEPGGLHGQPDEDYWVNPVAPVTWLNIYPKPWFPTDDIFPFVPLTSGFVIWIQEEDS